MRFFTFLLKVFRGYDSRDKLLTAGGLLVILLMLVKMLVFPYGFFGFGDSNVYTEGMVSRNGIQNLNPLFVDYNEADREISSLVFSGLMKYDPSTKSVVDDMAALSVNVDKTQYTFVLRQGLKWHDGANLTADDVFFTYNDLVMSPSFPNEILKTNFAGVKVEQLDERTVKFTLEKPNVFFVNNLTLGILPKHLLSDVDAYDLLQNEFNKQPVGSGPYMVVEPPVNFSDGRMQVSLERNPFYYGPVSDIKLFRFIVYTSFDDLIKDTNVFNSAVKVTGDYADYFKEDDRFELIEYELPQYTAVFMNMESEALKDVIGLRSALRSAVDKKSLVGGLFGKVPVEIPLMELNQEDWVSKYDVEAAGKSLTDAGYVYEATDTEFTGLRYKDGKPLELIFLARLYDEGSVQFNETQAVLTFLQDSWLKIGVDVRIDLVPSDVFKGRIMQRDYDLLLVGQGLGYNLDTYSYWHSTQANPNGQNLSNYKSFQVDSLIEEIRTVFELSKKEENLKAIATKLKEDIPAIFLYRPIYYYASDGKIDGVDLGGVVFPNDRFSNISDWRFTR